MLSVESYGLIADGSSHPLSSMYGSLAAAQAVYPFATALTQEIDFCACKAASNAAFGADGVEHGSSSYLNKKLFLPNGRYQFGNDTWLIRNLVSGVIEGAGMLATTIYGNVTSLAFDGLWYSELANFSIELQQSNATVALDVDGNVPGHPYSTRGVQGNNLRNLLVNGGGSTYAVALTRQGGSSAQGSECVYTNLHLANASYACYYQNGFNNVANTFYGGDIQNYPMHGVYAVGGTVHVIATSFESTTGYTQILNDGYDIRVGDAGSYNFCLIHGSRTESMRFLYAGAGTLVDVRGISSNNATSGWAAGTSYPLHSGIVEGASLFSLRLFVATTGGTSGGSKPNFPAVATGGTVSDNGIVWTETEFNFMNVATGSVDRESVHILGPGNLKIPERYVTFTSDSTAADVYLDDSTEFAAIDTTNGHRDVYLPVHVEDGRKITIKKTDTSANTVLVRSLNYTIESGTTVIPGGALGSVTFQLLEPNLASNPYWLLVGKI